MIIMFLFQLTSSRRSLVSVAAFAADILNQLLDFYDESQRQIAESAQTAATGSATQHSARPDTVPSTATMPQAKVETIFEQLVSLSLLSCMQRPFHF